MAVMRKILKNNTALSMNILGIVVAPGGTIEVAPNFWQKLASELLIHQLVSTSEIQVSDGTSYLSASEGLKWVKQFSTDRSSDIYFSYSGYTSTNAQDAIVESRNTAEGKSRFLACCGFDGNASNGRYLEFNSNVDSNQSGFVIPRAAVMHELSLVHTSNSAVNFNILNWNGTTETLLTSISTTASQRKATVTGLTISLAENSELRVKCTSGSSSRPIVFSWYLFN
jgi:hypothetical protein